MEKVCTFFFSLLIQQKHTHDIWLPHIPRYNTIDSSHLVLVCLTGGAGGFSTSSKLSDMVCWLPQHQSTLPRHQQAQNPPLWKINMTQSQWPIIKHCVIPDKDWTGIHFSSLYWFHCLKIIKTEYLYTLNDETFNTWLHGINIVIHVFLPDLSLYTTDIKFLHH